jgi:hypothetical protein
MLSVLIVRCVSFCKKGRKQVFGMMGEQNETVFTWYRQKVELLKTWIRVQQ